MAQPLTIPDGSSRSESRASKPPRVAPRYHSHDSRISSISGSHSSTVISPRLRRDSSESSLKREKTSSARTQSGVKLLHGGCGGGLGLGGVKLDDERHAHGGDGVSVHVRRVAAHRTHACTSRDSRASLATHERNARIATSPFPRRSAARASDHQANSSMCRCSSGAPHARASARIVSAHTLRAAHVHVRRDEGGGELGHASRHSVREPPVAALSREQVQRRPAIRGERTHLLEVRDLLGRARPAASPRSVRTRRGPRAGTPSGRFPSPHPPRPFRAPAGGEE